MTLLPLDPPVWVDDPSKYPSEGEHNSIVQAATRAASSYGPKRQIVEATRKAKFRLTKAQLRLIPIVAQQLQNAGAEVFAAFYIRLELAVACAVSTGESSGRNIYGADPASSWMNTNPAFGELWEHDVTEASYRWFGQHVDQGYTSNGVGPKQLTSRSLQ